MSPVTLVVASTMLLLAVSAGPASGVPPATAAGAVPSAASEFHAVAPARIMDTRIGLGGSTFAAGESRTLQIAGRAGLPASGVVAASVNVTVTGATSGGFLTVWPAGSALPPTSNLNFAAGETRANAVVTGVDTAGMIALFNAMGRADVVVDVTGWFSGDFVGITPARLLDTRTTTRMQPGEIRRLQVAAQGGVPSGAAAVAITVTATTPSAAGYVSVWPDGTPWPGTSNVNFSAGDTIAATALVGLGTGGGISIKNAGGTTDVIIDVMGWFSGGLVAGVPARVFDTRDATGSCGVFLDPFETRTIMVAGRGGLPATDISAVVLNVTVTDPEAAGYVTVWPAGGPQPVASTVNYAPGQTVANAALIGLGSAGEVSIFNGGDRPTDIVVDVTGYFTGTTAGGAPAPCPSSTIDRTVPVPGRRLPNGTIAVSAFNATLDALGPDALAARSPVQLALALTADANRADARSLTVRSSTEGEGEVSEVPSNVVVDADGFLDDSVAGIHNEVRLVPRPDGTLRVDRATWGYICYRRPSPPFSPALCP